MSARSRPLASYPVVRSKDPEVFRDRLFGVYGASSFDIGKRNRRFGADANHLQMGALGLSYCDYASDVSIGFGEATFVRQFFSIGGAAQYTAGMHSGEIKSGSWSPILGAHAPLQLDFKAGYRQIVLRIEFNALLRNLGTLLGQEVGRNLEFDRAATFQPMVAILRRRLFDFVADDNERGPVLSALAAAEFERMVIMEFLMCHKHNYTHLLLREPPSTGPAAVRAVEEFIEANWNKPISIETMAAVANVSARSLFRQFRRDRGYSPADFVKRVRLHRAKELLSQPQGRASVTGIAFECGFHNLGHFARDYRRLFGALPSDTLRTSLRQRCADSVSA